VVAVAQNMVTVLVLIAMTIGFVQHLSSFIFASCIIGVVSIIGMDGGHFKS